MLIPVVAIGDVETFLPGTEITVKIPDGTRGSIVKELTKQVVLVQFDVPSLGPVRIDRSNLKSGETLEILLEEMGKVVGSKPTSAKQVHAQFSAILFRALRLLADDTNKDTVERIIRTYEQVLLPRKQK